MRALTALVGEPAIAWRPQGDMLTTYSSNIMRKVLFLKYLRLPSILQVLLGSGKDKEYTCMACIYFCLLCRDLFFVLTCALFSHQGSTFDGDLDSEAEDVGARASPSPLQATESFTVSHISSRSSSPTDLVISTSSFTADSPTSSPNPCVTKRKRKRDQTDDASSTALTNLSTLSTHKERPCLNLGKVICNELEDMTGMQRKLARKLIMDVIHLGSMDQLTVNHQVTQPVGSNQSMA